MGRKKPTMLIAYMLVDTVSIHSKEQYEMAMVCEFFFQMKTVILTQRNGNSNDMFISIDSGAMHVIRYRTRNNHK